MLFHYKLLRKLAFVGSLCLTVNAVAKAEGSCSYVEFIPDQQSEIKINQVNDAILYQGLKSFNSWNKENTFRINEGQYEFFGAVVDKKPSVVESLFLHPDLGAAPVYFGLEIEQGKLYQVSIIREDGEVVDLDVNEKTITGCPFPKSIFVDELESEKTQQQVTLPKAHKLKLQQIFFDVMQEQEYDSVESIAPAGFTTDFGWVFKKHNDDLSGLEVLSITPYSVANQLGIKSGDTILNVNGYKLTGKFSDKKEQLDNAIASLQRGIKIVLDRSGERYSLSDELNNLFIPQYSYAINQSKSDSLKKHLPIQSSARYQLDFQILEIVEHYRAQSLNSERIHFAVPAEIDSRIGVTGVKQSENGYTGVKVSFIRKNSVAEQLGLKVGDLILKIDDITPTPTSLDLTKRDYVSKDYRIDYVRGGEQKSIANKAQVRVFPEISMVIDLKDESSFLADKNRHLAISRKVAMQYGLTKTGQWLAARNNDLTNVTLLSEQSEVVPARSTRVMVNNSGRAQTSVAASPTNKNN